MPCGLLLSHKFICTQQHQVLSAEPRFAMLCTQRIFTVGKICISGRKASQGPCFHKEQDSGISDPPVLIHSHKRLMLCLSYF